ncbi:MAG: hypothetical protein P8X79_17555 [Reinekea sp.]
MIPLCFPGKFTKALDAITRTENDNKLQDKKALPRQKIRLGNNSN